MSATLSRRQLLRYLAIAPGIGLLAACSPTPAAAPTAAATAKPAAPASAPTTAPAPAPAAAPTSAPAPASAPAAKPGGQAPFDVAQLYEAAKKEGTLSWVFPVQTQQGEELIRAFNTTYPGIKVAHTTAATNVVVERLLLELQAKKVTMDVADPGRDARILQQDAALSLTDILDAINLPKERRYGDDRLALFSPLGHGVIYNTTRVAAGDVPKKWEDLLSGKFKGQMVMEERLKGFIYLTDLAAYKGKYPGLLSEDQVTEILKGLKAQEPVIMAGNTPVSNAVASGEYALSPDLNVASLGIAKYVQKAPVDLAPVGPISVEHWLIFVPKSAPHPNAAKLFVQWLLSPEGTKQRISSNPGYEPAPGSGDPIADLIQQRALKIVYSGIELFDEYERLDKKYKGLLGIPTA